MVDSDDKKKHGWTWERSIEILKVVATVWVALLGSFVTMQFNERQHELNRIEAIAKMLPHMSAAGNVTGSGGPTTAQDMSRQGAIWAIFRTAQNRAMLRDLAALFPADIYGVVSSIAVAGELQHDPDALTALQITSEKLATQLSADPKYGELASRLYAQAVRLKEHKPDDTTPIHVVDLTSANVDMSASQDPHYLIRMVNDLAEIHARESEEGKIVGSGRSQSRQLYQRAIDLGTDSKIPEVQLQVMRAQLGLASLYVVEKRLKPAYKLLKDEDALSEAVNGAKGPDMKSMLDPDKNGFANEAELASVIAGKQKELNEKIATFHAKGVKLD